MPTQDEQTEFDSSHNSSARIDVDEFLATLREEDIDLYALAEEIYKLMKQELRLEQQRLGRFNL